MGYINIPLGQTGKGLKLRKLAKIKNDRISFNKQRIIKRLNEADDRVPNIYSLLIDRGVSDHIASEAQELISEAFSDAVDYYNSQICDLVEEATERLDRIMAPFYKKLERFEEKETGV